MDERRIVDSESRNSWILYVALLLCRVVLCPFLPGYIHPDEFFQGGQELWFGCPPFTPWEFQPEYALRSVFPPTVMTRLPLALYAWIIRADNGVYSLSGREVLVVPRVVCGLLSILTVDVTIWCLTRGSSSSKAVPHALLVFASAWPSLVLLNRPFTNSLETMLLAVLLLLTNQRQTTHPLTKDLCVGITCALGLFTRFTFVFFAVPTALRYLVSKPYAMPLSSALLGCSVMAIGFFGTSAVIAHIDALYYNAASRSDGWISHVALTPWNALLYNSQVNNLEHHGLHPRWTHATVNMLLLYGPLVLLFYSKGILSFCSFVKLPTKASVRSDSPNTAVHGTTLPSTCVWTILSGLGFLSLAPHQEPRFLLPLLVPLAILSRSVWKVARIRAVWIAFNVILLTLYGILHQGGIVPSLFALQHRSEGNAPRAVLYYHTYMPPTFVSRKRNGEHGSSSSSSSSINGNADAIKSCAAESLPCGDFPIIDLEGSSARTLLSSLKEHVGCEEQGKGDSTSGNVYLVSPPLRIDDILIGGSDCFLRSLYSCRKVQSHRPHLTTEDFPPLDGSIAKMLSNMELGVYEISCVSNSGT